jgi:glycosyltransferase involved in cell wall biosynthesis
MKLAVILPHTKLYGGVKRFLELGNYFVEKGHVFCVYTPDGEAPDWFRFKGRMSTFSQLPNAELDALWTTTTRFVSLMLSSRARHKIFYHVRIKENLREVLRHPEIEIYACSSNVYRYDLNHYGRKAFLAAGGVNVAAYQPKSDYSCEQRPFVVMAYGRIAERVKGTKYVVKACERLYRKGYDVKLLLFDTALSPEWQRKLDAFDCLCPFDFVQNHPFERNSELFNRADCFVSAENPHYSGWNNTVAEAMACALPVISTKAGTDDLLVDGVNGIRSARWVFCFERHIKELYRDEALRQRLGMAAREHVKQFDWSLLAHRILQHLND